MTPEFVLRGQMTEAEGGSPERSTMWLECWGLEPAQPQGRLETWVQSMQWVILSGISIHWNTNELCWHWSSVHPPCWWTLACARWFETTWLLESRCRSSVFRALPDLSLTGLFIWLILICILYNKVVVLSIELSLVLWVSIKSEDLRNFPDL